jgi:DNA-binding transcriptional LysR family regulator
MQSWDDLRFILAVARHGTIADGAKALAVNATTVSRRLRAMESEAGTALFEKLKHGAVLTGAGEEMVTVAEAVEQLVDALDARVHGLDAKLEGTIRVTSTDIFLNHWMPEIAAFRERYPGIELELTSGYSSANLTRREADVAVRIAPQAPEHLLGRKHAEVFFAVYGAPALIDEVGERASYAAFPWLAWDLSVGRATDRYLEGHVPGARIVMRVDRMAPMITALEQGVGITILPCIVGDARPTLRRLGDYFEGGTFLWVLTHPELRGSARVRAFTEFVRTLIARDLGQIEGTEGMRCALE